MSCTGNLPLLDGCAVRPVKGIANIWAGLLTDFVITFSNNRITNITKAGVGVLVPLLGAKEFCNAKYDAVIRTGLKDAYKHTVEILNISCLGAVDKQKMDDATNQVFVVLTNQGEYLVYGAHYGVWKDKLSLDSNANNGQWSLSFSTRDGMEEQFSEYVLEPTTGTPAAKIISLL